jgi:hypothetical protein
MPKAYSLDLRERVARFVEGGRFMNPHWAHPRIDEKVDRKSPINVGRIR